VTTARDTRSYPPTRLALHASRIVIDVGVLLVLGAMSLPFISAEGFGQRAVAADALPALLLVLPVFVITLLPDQTRPVPSWLGWAALLLAATAAPYALVKALDASSLAHTLGARVGAGAWVLVVGAFVTLAGILYGLVRNLLHLPVAGTYPTRPQPAVPASPRRSAAAAPVPSPPAGRAPSGPALARPAAVATRQPSPAATPRPTTVPPAGTPAPQPSAAPRPTDPDTEPTLPAIKPVRHWWPDDLEDLFD